MIKLVTSLTDDEIKKIREFNLTMKSVEGVFLCDLALDAAELMKTPTDLVTTFLKHLAGFNLPVDAESVGARARAMIAKNVDQMHDQCFGRSLAMAVHDQVHANCPSCKGGVSIVPDPNVH